MGVYKYNNQSYDINENKNQNFLNEFKVAVTIPSKSSKTFRTAKEVGYCGTILYTIDILSGLKHSIEDYNYKSLIILLLKEIYSDSDGVKHTIHKLINLGGYVTEKNKPLTVKHITAGFCGQLISVEGVIINNSAFSITVQNLGLYRSMEYSNSNIEGDVLEIDRNRPVVIDEDDSWGEYIDVYVEKGITPYGSIKDRFNYIQKTGSNEYWYTTSLFLPLFQDYASNNTSSWIKELTWYAFDDKGNYLGTNSEVGFNIPDYSEYVLFTFLQSYTGKIDLTDINNVTRLDRVIYTNNIGRKYNGNATKYQCKFIDAMDAKYTNDEDAVIFEHIESENNIVANNKYDNGVGVITVQMIIEPVYESEERVTKYYYISTQPFKYSGLQAYPVVINEHLFYYLTGIKYKDEEPITSNIDVVYTTTEQYKKLLADSERVLLQKLLAEDLNNIVEYAQALEDKYPDGNLEDSGGAW